MNDIPPARDFRDVFKATGSNHRGARRLLSVMPWYLGAGAFVAWLTVPRIAEVALLVFLASIGMSAVGILLAKGRLTCPACEQDVDDENGQFCPVCGTESVRKAGFWDRFPRCLECRARLIRFKPRQYRIRFCRHCGAYLDTEGI